MHPHMVLGLLYQHSIIDGTEQPIALASCSLTAPEWNYEQTDKEALSLV